MKLCFSCGLRGCPSPSLQHPMSSSGWCLLLPRCLGLPALSSIPFPPPTWALRSAAPHSRISATNPFFPSPSPLLSFMLGRSRITSPGSLQPSVPHGERGREPRRRGAAPESTAMTTTSASACPGQAAALPPSPHERRGKVAAQKEELFRACRGSRGGRPAGLVPKAIEPPSPVQ